MCPRQKEEFHTPIALHDLSHVHTLVAEQVQCRFTARRGRSDGDFPHPPPPSTTFLSCAGLPANTLREAQFEVPALDAVYVGLRPGQNDDDDDNPAEPKH